MSFVNYEVWKAKEVAEKYLSGVRGAVPLAQVQIEIMVRIIDSCNVKIEKILDLGCGDGILSAAVLQHIPYASCVLLDISEPMLQAAKEKLVNYNDKLSFRLLDYGDSRWIDKVKIAGPFDVIISGFSIHHQNDDRKQELYSEIFELLKSGGLFLNLEHVSLIFRMDHLMNILSIHCIICTFEMMLEKRGKKLRMNFIAGMIKRLIYWHL